MSPVEAAALLAEPDWAQLFKDRGADEFAFENIMIEWRRFHWTPVTIDGVEKKKPAGSTEAMIALASLGVMPPRTLAPEHEGYQYDDHTWLQVAGEQWKIIGIEDKMLCLDRLDGETKQIDLNRAKWEKYIETAQAVLQAKKDGAA